LVLKIFEQNAGYIDDISCVEASYSIAQNVTKIETHMEREACPRAERMGLKFDLPKFQLLHFVPPRRHAEHYDPLPVTFNGITIEASTSRASTRPRQ
jgi:hypothetical protein